MNRFFLLAIWSAHLSQGYADLLAITIESSVSLKPTFRRWQASLNVVEILCHSFSSDHLVDSWSGCSSLRLTIWTNGSIYFSRRHLQWYELVQTAKLSTSTGFDNGYVEWRGTRSDGAKARRTRPMTGGFEAFLKAEPRHQKKRIGTNFLLPQMSDVWRTKRPHRISHHGEILPLLWL